MIRKTTLLALASCAVLSACSYQHSQSQSYSDTASGSHSEAHAKAEQHSASHTHSMQAGLDYHSYANPEQVALKHIDLDLNVNFDTKIMSGTAELTYTKVDPNADTLIVDTRDLTIEKITSYGEPVEFKLGEADENLGAPLAITLPKSGSSVVVHYHTSPEASGVQWLTPQQTAGKKHPFLFTQAQATHARSFIPLQDSPKVRVTYNATIRTPKSLLAVMSASNDPETPRDGEYHFKMPQPIPSYLIALGVGDLEFKPMGKRTGVYAEPSMLEAAAKEFEDTESMLIATEKRYGPYSWDRYDLLILPPSFPFGGMENPRLSFITPTVIAGDKSLVSLIAHELAHSWSGNTVTNATWRDLWLNEGFTTYLTYRIMEIVYGTERFDQEAVLGYQDLQADISALPEKDEVLAIDLRGRDPDDVFSNIPYEKGALFLREIEHAIGRDNFDAFLKNYFAHFAFQSITTDEFLAYLQETLLKQYPNKLNMQRINQWIFEAGVPEGAPQPESNAFEMVDTARNAWLNGEKAAMDIDTQKWTVHQWLYFLNNMPETLSAEQMQKLDAAFNLTQSHNNEIAHAWLMHVVKNWYEPALPRLHNYLVSIGRNKLVRPLYRELSKTPKGKALAKKAFEQAKAGYHPLTVKANEGYVN
ncbi:M1 family metallopeptidase [Alteromonas sp. a30]|uniref:M1 family metallopeptidase n=1 Tax=Alteromonas sp. a30 TaxID=2730917 RepID=UPI00227E92B9|nr:M1 family metallopeptidase [Alteromonas sp. a30]MCY7297359.1 M1 family metallopeptidase [Alteromonas sp. a30]